MNVYGVYETPVIVGRLPLYVPEYNSALVLAGILRLLTCTKSLALHDKASDLREKAFSSHSVAARFDLEHEDVFMNEKYSLAVFEIHKHEQTTHVWIGTCVNTSPQA